MSKKIMWLVVSGLMALSLVMAACGPAPVEEEKGKEAAPVVKEEKAKEEKGAVEKEVAEKEVVSPVKPRYGGTLKLAISSDITGWDDIVTRSFTPGATFRVTNEAPWAGDWAKGPAGGYGTNENDWTGSAYDVFDLNTGHIAESWKWSVDTEKDEGTLVYQIRQGVHFALNPDSEASRLVGGREVTPDDLVFSLNQIISIPTSYVYKANPDLRAAKITKTGPWEVTIKVPTEALIQAISRFGNYGRVVPPEVVKKYGSMANWQNSVGTGPFMLTDYVAGSVAVMDKNPNYWGKDPVGPGKGNQVPYIDGYRLLIIPDLSTRLAALRTGKIDQMVNISWEDATQFRKSTPELLEKEGGVTGYFPTFMRTDKAPFNDVRVRRAMHMAIDFKAIHQSLNGGLGQIITWPFEYSKPYADLYLGLDDPEMPESVRELFTYNPEKAKQLLAEAGYPNGFKTSVLITNTQVDYYSIIKDMWSKVGIDLKLDVREPGTVRSIINKRQHEALSSQGRTPTSIFYLAPSLTGEGGSNQSMLNDPVINEAIADIRRTAITDLHEAMRKQKELSKYVLDQAYAITKPSPPSYIFWWPWLKNYSGENSMGYFVGDFWATWIWIDQDLKKQMGY